MAAFKDHFSNQSNEYAKYRPGYPDALFDWLASLVPETKLAWDVGTGSGQAALGLARHFLHVVASDAAEAQLRKAPAHERITYKVMPAEQSDLQAGSADLVTVAQALHWFDFDRFYAEVRRVLAPGGVIAAWTYGLNRVGPEIDRVVRRYYLEVVGPYWPPEREHVDKSYRTIPFPFDEIEPPAFRMRQQWRLHDLLGYLGTWSASKRYAEARGTDPTEEIRPVLEQLWTGDEERSVEWPVHMRVGRISRA